MLTDNEIIQAYACCNINEYGGCEECPCKQDGECIIPTKGFELDKAVYDAFNRLQNENKQLQSDVITANQNLEHFKELWEEDKAKAKEIIKKYIDKYDELILCEKEIGDSAVKVFAQKLVEKAKFFGIDNEGDFIDSEIGKYEIHDSFADATIYLCEHVIEEWVGDEV